MADIEETFEFIETPAAKPTPPSNTDCGVRTTSVRLRSIYHFNRIRE